MVVKPGHKLTEIGAIPKDWSISTLGEICTFENGDRSSKYPSPSSFVDSGVPFINAGHLDNGVIHRSNMDYIKPDAYNRLGGGKIKAGDILFCLRGSLGKFGVVGPDFGAGAIASSLVIVRLKSAWVDHKFLNEYFASPLCARMIVKWAGGAAQPNLGAQDLARFSIVLPPTGDEQRAIAAALGDAAAAITGLDRLIKKKSDLRQAAMQQLLTGLTRLPGFDGEWEVRPLGDIARIKTGSRNNEEKVDDGRYPFFVRSETVERIDTFLYDSEAILVPGEGRIGEIFHYINGRFDVHQRVYAITQFVPDVSARFAYYLMSLRFGAWAMQNTVKATVDSLRLPTFQRFEMLMPPTLAEQQAIAEVLVDFDAEISALGAQRGKTFELTTAMMQELLTGKTRLIAPELTHA